MTMSQALAPDRASITSCTFEADPACGKILVATVSLGDERYRYRIESSRSWRSLGFEEISVDRQRLIDFALWGYLRDFTGEIDARLAPRSAQSQAGSAV